MAAGAGFPGGPWEPMEHEPVTQRQERMLGAYSPAHMSLHSHGPCVRVCSGLSHTEAAPGANGSLQGEMQKLAAGNQGEVREETSPEDKWQRTPA